MGIASQKVGVESAVGKGAWVGVIGRVPKASTHGFSASKLTGDTARNEPSRAARLATTKLNKPIFGTQEETRKRGSFRWIWRSQSDRREAAAA